MESAPLTEEECKGTTRKGTAERLRHFSVQFPTVARRTDQPLVLPANPAGFGYHQHKQHRHPPVISTLEASFQTLSGPNQPFLEWEARSISDKTVRYSSVRQTVPSREKGTKLPM